MRSRPFVAVLFLAACQTQTMERDPMGRWLTPEQAARANTPRTGRGADGGSSSEPAKPPRTITVSPEVAKPQNEFIARKSTIFGDVVEIDLSRSGWFPQATFAVSRDAVIRRDDEDQERGILTITLQRVPGVAATMESVPTVHFGEGLRVVGVDRVTLRFWSQPSADRPMWFHAVGAGKSAFYKIESEPPQEWRGTSVDVRAEIHLVGEEYRFDSSQEARR